MMEFHPGKCQVLCIGPSKHGKLWEFVNKYLSSWRSIYSVHSSTVYSSISIHGLGGPVVLWSPNGKTLSSTRAHILDLWPTMTTGLCRLGQIPGCWNLPTTSPGTSTCAPRKFRMPLASYGETCAHAQCDVKETCYNAFMQPIVEHASGVWDPITQRNITEVEAVQHQSARLFMNDFSQESSPSAMNNTLGWEPLQDCRAVSKAGMWFYCGFAIFPLF